MMKEVLFILMNEYADWEGTFLATHGFLNHVRHTGNGVDQLKLRGGKAYT